jgi:hypothetical protein
VGRRQVYKEVVFEEGALVDCRSNLANETHASLAASSVVG